MNAVLGYLGNQLALLNCPKATIYKNFNPTKSGLALSNFQDLMEYIYKDVNQTKSGVALSNFQNLME